MLIAPPDRLNCFTYRLACAAILDSWRRLHNYVPSLEESETLPTRKTATRTIFSPQTKADRTGPTRGRRIRCTHSFPRASATLFIRFAHLGLWASGLGVRWSQLGVSGFGVSTVSRATCGRVGRATCRWGRCCGRRFRASRFCHRSVVASSEAVAS